MKPTADMVARHLAGESLSQLAQASNVAMSTMVRWFRAAGIKTRPRNRAINLAAEQGRGWRAEPYRHWSSRY